MALDDIDRKILRLLQTDGRMSLAKLSDEVGLSPSPCLRRVRALEASGVITRYVAVLDQQRVGVPVSVFASIKLEKQQEASLTQFAKAGVALAECSNAIDDGALGYCCASC